MRVDLAYAERQLRHWTRKVEQLRLTSNASNAEKETEEKRDLPPTPPIERKEAKKKTSRSSSRNARARGDFPSIDDVAAECQRIGSNVDPEYFWNYYNANDDGWPCDWKSALVVWTKHRKRDGRVAVQDTIEDVSLQELERRRVKAMSEELAKKFK